VTVSDYEVRLVNERVLEVQADITCLDSLITDATLLSLASRPSELTAYGIRLDAGLGVTAAGLNLAA
jgi:hypothetical protein